jgi:hypothetical protein
MNAIDPTAQESGPLARDAGEDHRQVTIELNDTTKQIEAGHYTGRSLRLALGIPLEYELEEVVHGEFKPIADRASIHIKGGEKFVSHVGHGRAS